MSDHKQDDIVAAMIGLTLTNDIDTINDALDKGLAVDFIKRKVITAMINACTHPNDDWKIFESGFALVLLPAPDSAA